MSKFFRCIVCAALVLNNTLLLFPTLHSSAATVETKAQRMLARGGEYDLDHVVVTYKNNPKEPKLVPVSASVASTITISTADNQDNRMVQDKHQRLEDKLNQLLNDPNVEAVQPQYIYKTEAWTRVSNKDTPNDFDLNSGSPQTGNHWYYEKEHLREMWQDQDCFNAGAGCGGSNSVIVAVIDTGLAYENRSTTGFADRPTPTPTATPSPVFTFTKNDDMFAAGNIHLWQNTAEINGNAGVNCSDGLDDDGNGYIDDCYGANTDQFINCSLIVSCDADQTKETGHPNDDGGHGTFVTGLITSLVDNALGSVSPAPNITLMPIKASFHDQGSFGSLQLIEAISYAVAHGAKVINMSLAGPTFDSGFNTAVQNAVNAGVTVIAASGNTNSAVSYPAAFDNVISVGAVTAIGSRAYYSNYGSNLDLVTYVGNGASGPGDAIYQRSYACFFINPSCYTSNDYSTFSTQYGIGTSYASPQVVALAALLISAKPNISRAALQAKMYAYATDINTPGFDNETGNGIINYEASYAAVAADVAPTITITEPNGTADTPDTSFNITWTDADPDDNATINLYYDNNASGLDGTLIPDCSNLSEDSATNNCVLDTRGFPPGSYYIYGCIYDNVNSTSTSPTCTYSTGAMTVSHTLKRDWGIISMNTQLSTVNFTTVFDAAPMLTVNDCSENGGEKYYVNVKNITSTNFQAQMVENTRVGYDNVHIPEAFCWYATQSFNTDEKVGMTSLDQNWKSVTFNAAFASAPKVFTTITTENDTDLAYTNVRNVTTTGFEMRIMEPQGWDGVHFSEKVNWIAFVDNPAGQEGFSSVTQSSLSLWTPVSFAPAFSTAPALVADMSTTNGGDPATIDVRNLTKNGFEYRIEEDPASFDGVHPLESINWAAFAYTTTNGLQSGTITVNQVFSTVTFPVVFQNAPKVFAEIDTENGGDTIQVDLQNVTNKSFQVRIEEDPKAGWDGIHTTETIAWYALPAPLATEQLGFAMIDTNWKTIPFSTPYISPQFPRVFAEIDSNFGTDTIKIDIRNVNLNSFDIKIEEDVKAGWDGGHMKEVIAWMAFDAASPPIGGTGKAGQLASNSNWLPVTFPSPFGSVPKLIADMNTVNGAEPARVDIRNLTTTGFEVRSEEQPHVYDGIHSALESVVWYAWP